MKFFGGNCLKKEILVSKQNTIYQISYEKRKKINKNNIYLGVGIQAAKVFPKFKIEKIYLFTESKK